MAAAEKCHEMWGCADKSTIETIKTQTALIESELKEHLAGTKKQIVKHLNCPHPIERHANLLFSKSLPHDANGNVNKRQLFKLIESCRNGNIKQMNSVKIGGTLKLHSCSNVMTRELFGRFKPETLLGVPPRVTSRTAGAEMVDLYWRALTRDVLYSDWPTSPLIAAAIQDLNACGSAYKGPKPVTITNIFRGRGDGVDIGPLVSQFLFLSFSQGSISIKQLRASAQPNVDYMTLISQYISCQNGTVTQTAIPSTLPLRYLVTPRDGATAVHSDMPVQWAQNAVQILTSLNAPFNNLNPFSPANNSKPKIPRITNEFNFIDCGAIDCVDLIARAIRLAFNTVWWYKWHIFRLRPENTGYLVQLNKTNQQHLLKHCPQLSDVILNSAVLPRVLSTFGSYLLPQAFPEGCPLHPSFSCGHCTMVTSSVTIVKAFYDGSFLMNAVIPDAIVGNTLVPLTQGASQVQLRVDQELNKIINNVAYWRDTAGVHYMSDELHGIPMGEAIAESVLEDCVQRYSFAAGFQFRNHAGKLVTITNFKAAPFNKSVGEASSSVVDDENTN